MATDAQNEKKTKQKQQKVMKKKLHHEGYWLSSKFLLRNCRVTKFFLLFIAHSSKLKNGSFLVITVETFCALEQFLTFSL